MNRWNPLGRGLGIFLSPAVVKGPPMHLPFRSKQSHGKRTGCSLNGGTDVQHVTLVALVRQVAR
jgi:hypothetical protein